jgi:hypothetical protein
MQVMMDAMHVHAATGGPRAPRSSPARVPDVAEGLPSPRTSSFDPELLPTARERVQKVREVIQDTAERATKSPSASNGATAKTGITEAPVPNDNEHVTEPATIGDADRARVAARPKAVGSDDGRLWVAESELKIHERTTSREWTFTIEVPLPNGRTSYIADGAVELDEHGHPLGGPQFVIDSRVTVDGKQLRVSIGDGASERASVTDVALDRAIVAFKHRFGHEPDELSGHLAMKNKANFQVEYLKAIDRGVPPQDAMIAAVKAISFGRARVERGYSDITVEAHGEDVITYGDQPQRRKVPDNIDVKARRK